MAVDFKRLHQAVEWSLRQLKTPREQRVEAVREFVGSHYADSGAKKNVPVNLIELAVATYVQRLAARAPAAMVSTTVDELKPFARNMALALNQIPREIGLESTIRRAVVEAIFGMGIVKVGIASGGAVVAGHDVGEPFVDLVTLDDYFMDMSAKSREAIQYEGNDYWLDIDAARELKSDLEPDEHSVYADNGSQRADGISADTGADLYTEKVWLRDVWLPKSQEVVTYAVKTQQVVRVVPWDGPENGPYHVLAYSDVPGNLLPLPPVALWRDLHELGNALFRKLSRQAMAKKTVAMFAGGNDADVEALKKSADGEGVRYNGQPPTPVQLGGIDAPTLAFWLQVKDNFNYVAGNLDALGGLAPLSDTATQDKLMTEGASARLSSMKSSTITFARRIFETLAWYEWTDPIRKRTIKKPVDGTDIVLTREWSAETREGDFLDYNLDIDPYSMEEETPQSRLQKVGVALERFIFPNLPFIQQQGGQLDFRKLIELVARLGNVDEMRELIRFGEPIQGEPAAGSPQTSFKPAETKRTYERVNRPGASRAGKDDVMGRILMGGGVQGTEAASMGRPVS